MNEANKLESSKRDGSRWKTMLAAVNRRLGANALESADCQSPACTVRRRLWRRLRWRHCRICLQDAWYCAPQCFEMALLRHLERHVAPALHRHFELHRFAQQGDQRRNGSIRTTLDEPVGYAANHRIPLGLLLLSRGQLNNTQLRAALERQQAQGGRIGECLESLGFASESQITAALAVQWSCPVWPATEASASDCVKLLPVALLRALRIYPLRFVAATRTFYLASSDRLDHSLLYAIGQMLQCQTEPCVMRPSVLHAFLAGIESIPHGADMLFERPDGYEEIARITCAYVLKLGVQQVRIAACRNYIWARLSAGGDVANLLFHFPLWGARDRDDPGQPPTRLRDAG